MASDLEKISALLDKALCWIDSGSAEARVILEARNIADALIEGAKNTEQQVQPDNLSKMCEECGQYPADSPSKLCCGCDAYKEHLS